MTRWAARAGAARGKLGDPEDVAYAMAYLASEEAGWITGRTLPESGPAA